MTRNNKRMLIWPAFYFKRHSNNLVSKAEIRCAFKEVLFAVPDELG
jgi:hypothetical protein